MNIPVARPMVGEEEIEAAIRVLRSGNYISGPEVAAFEEEFADYIGVKYAVACNSGTAALQLALQALSIEHKNQEVIVPSMSFFASVSSVVLAGATPIFADVDDRCNIDPNDIQQYLWSGTKAIIPVHLYGHPCQIDKINQIAKKNNLFVIEDCAQAHGAEFKGKKVGSLGHIGCFSFFATKNMTTIEGGMITTNNEDVASQAKVLRSHGMIDRHTHIKIAQNFRMNEVSAAIGRVQLRKLGVLNRTRIENSLELLDGIEEKEWFKLYQPEDHVKDVYFWFPIYCNKPQQFIEYLNKHDIGFRFRYHQPLYNQPCLNGCYSYNFRKNADVLSGRMFGLPNYPGLTKYQISKVIDVVNNFKPE